MDSIAAFAAAGLTLYAAHHVGDYWVQTDHQARHKGDGGSAGRRACLAHIYSYVVTQSTLLAVAGMVLGIRWGFWASTVALLVSALTHYAADRREHGLMFKLARAINLGGFLKLGVPRNVHVACEEGCKHPLDNPSLGTGAWALDQSWHIFWGVFVPALILGAAA